MAYGFLLCSFSIALLCSWVSLKFHALSHIKNESLQSSFEWEMLLCQTVVPDCCVPGTSQPLPLLG